MRHSIPDDIHIDARGNEHGIGILEYFGELGDVVVGPAESERRALALEILERCLVLGVAFATDNGQAREFFAEQSVADGCADLAYTDDDAAGE